jgi:tetraacyldisaccharide 4'-kinase
MAVLKFLLLPLAILYDLVMDIRNRLYDLKLKPSASFAVPVIGVGNLAVGGTGKTPMVEYLIRLLQPKGNLVALSRGYGRKTKGFRIASPNENADTLGDEPMQLYQKYGSQVLVAVAEERAHAIPLILDQHPRITTVLLDDAFQHRKVKAGFSVLLTEYSRPFYSDYVLPYGRLREGPEGAQRADAIVVTKCPAHLTEEERMRIRYEVRKFAPCPVYFSAIRFGAPRNFSGEPGEPASQVILVSGIANPKPLEEFLAHEYRLVKHFNYRDHHRYRLSDLQKVEQYVQSLTTPVSVITTEKDKVKLDAPAFRELVSRLPFFYLPIEMEFIGNSKDFDTLVLDFVNREPHS